MIIDLVRYLGVCDSADVMDSVLRFRTPILVCWGLFTEGFRARSVGDARVWGRGEVTGAAVGLACLSLLFDLGGVSKGLVVSSVGSLFCSPSRGRSDSVDPLFLSDRVDGRSVSVNRASSICRRAIWLLSSSNLLFQSGTDVARLLRASAMEKAEKAISSY